MWGQFLATADYGHLPIIPGRAVRALSRPGFPSCRAVMLTHCDVPNRTIPCWALPSFSLHPPRMCVYLSANSSLNPLCRFTLKEFASSSVRKIPVCHGECASKGSFRVRKFENCILFMLIYYLEEPSTSLDLSEQNLTSEFSYTSQQKERAAATMASRSKVLGLRLCATL